MQLSLQLVLYKFNDYRYDCYNLLQRRTIVNGEVEPTDEQCEWPSDDEDDEDLADEAGEKLKIEDKEDSADSG